MAAFLAVGLLIRPAADYKSVKSLWKKILLPILITAAVGTAAISPVLIQNYKVTGYPVPDARMIPAVQALPVINTFFTPRLTEPEHDPRLLPHTRVVSSDNGNRERSQEFFKNFFRGAYELYFTLALLGAVLFAVRKKWRKEYSFLLLYCFLVSPIFIFFSVAHRYFIFVIPLVMVFTLEGIGGIVSFFRRYEAGNLVSAGFAALILLQPLNAWLWMMDRSDMDEFKIRKYIQENRFQFPSGRKLKIHGDMRMVYRSGEDRLFQYGEYFPEGRYVTGFDILLIEKKRADDVAGCMARRDLRVLESPFRRFIVFVPNKELKDE